MSDKMTDEEAIEALTDEDVVNPYLTLEALEIAIEALKERIERKTGKWVVKPNEYGRAFCSVCDYELHINNTKYCPNCGAKMEVDE